MNALSPALHLTIRDSATILDNTEELKKAVVEKTILEKERDTVDLLLGLTPKERKKQSPELYDSCFKQASDKAGVNKALKEWTLGAFLLGVFPAFFASLAIGPLPLLVVMGSPLLVLSIDDIAKKFLPPGKIDALMTSRLQEEKNRVASDLKNVQIQIDQANAKIVDKANKLEAQPQSIQEIEEEPDYLMIDGIRLKKHKWDKCRLPAHVLT